MTEPKTIVVHAYRSAATGLFVSKAYAEQNPTTTIRQAITKTIKPKETTNG